MNIFSNNFRSFVLATLTDELIICKPKPIPAGEMKELLAFRFGSIYAESFTQSFIGCAKMICEEKNAELVYISGGPTAGFYISGTVGNQFAGEPLLFSRKIERAKAICSMHVKGRGGLALDFLTTKLLEPGSKSDDKKRMRKELEEAFDGGKIEGFSRTESLILPQQ